MMNNKKASEYSALVLAYIGDAIYEAFTREKVLLSNPDMPAHKLHIQNVRYVKAKAQSDAMIAIEPVLKDKELAIYKRGRNAKSGTVPKNADLTEYRRATGFEALIGFLYLEKETDRLLEIMEIAYKNASYDKE